MKLDDGYNYYFDKVKFLTVFGLRPKGRHWGDVGISDKFKARLDRDPFITVVTHASTNRYRLEIRGTDHKHIYVYCCENYEEAEALRQLMQAELHKDTQQFIKTKVDGEVERYFPLNAKAFPMENKEIVPELFNWRAA